MGYLAAGAFAVMICALFALDRDREIRTSKGLWVATFWILIAASRGVSQWWHADPSIQTSAQYAEGSPIDRLILSGLLVMGVLVLLSRWKRAGAILKMNWPILLYFGYCVISVLWSDFPDVAFKRWVRAMGDLIVVLIILTERNRLGAIKRVLTRLSFLLVPLSVLLIEFFPTVGRVYSEEEAVMANTGVTLNKNQLGSLCLIVGLASVWRLSIVLGEKHRTRRLMAHGMILSMVVWLLYMAHSATSLACFVLGSGLILLLALPGKPRAMRVHFITGTVAGIGLLLATLPEAFGSFVEVLGRSTNMTGRTQVWHAVLGMHTNPWIGTGFMSFWLGSRLERLWSIFYFYVQEAHNGYLEIYLNLGWIGVALLLLVLAVGYRNVVNSFRNRAEEGSFQVAIFLVAIVYNITESAFRQNIPMWIFLLLVITATPLVQRQKVAEVEGPDADMVLESQLVGGIGGYEEIA